jgi:hypothetical protein
LFWHVLIRYPAKLIHCLCSFSAIWLSAAFLAHFFWMQELREQRADKSSALLKRAPARGKLGEANVPGTVCQYE